MQHYHWDIHQISLLFHDDLKFKIIRLNLKEINANENSQKIIHYLCKKVMDLSKQLSEKKENELKVIPLTFANGWSNYGSGHAPGKIIKKGNEITLRGLIKGTNFSTVCILPEDFRPKNVLIFSLKFFIEKFSLSISPSSDQFSSNLIKSENNSKSKFDSFIFNFFVEKVKPFSHKHKISKSLLESILKTISNSISLYFIFLEYS